MFNQINVELSASRFLTLVLSIPALCACFLVFQLNASPALRMVIISLVLVGWIYTMARYAWQVLPQSVIAIRINNNHCKLTFGSGKTLSCRLLGGSWVSPQLSLFQFETLEESAKKPDQGQNKALQLFINIAPDRKTARRIAALVAVDSVQDRDQYRRLRVQHKFSGTPDTNADPLQNKQM